MMLLIAAYLGLVGTAFGSFVGLVADRLPDGKTIFAKRSHCSNERCGHELGLGELVPVASYLWLQGRCRVCGVRIPSRLLFVEIGMGVLFGAIGLRYGLAPETAVVAGYAALLLVISLIDWDRALVLDKLTVPGAVLAIAFAPLAPWAVEGVADSWIRAVTGAVVGFLVLFPISFLAPKWMGFGDVKLAGLIGGMSGFPLVGVALWSGTVLGGLVGAALLVTGVRKRREAIPFAPYLAAGGVIALLYGRPLLDWYLELVRTGF